MEYKDFNDYEHIHYSSPDPNPIFYIILFAIMIIGIIWFKIVLSNSRDKEINHQTTFLTNIQFTAFTTYYGVKQNYSYVYHLKEYFKEENGKVSIPQYSKCIILEYVPNDHSFVKVKFDKYPKPLYVPRWYLRTPDEINK